MPGEKYEYGIDFDRVAAIDIHTHVEVDGHGHKAYDDELVDAVGKYFKMGPGALSSVDALADEYRRHNTAAVVFTIDARTGMRHVPNSVEDLIAGAIRNNDVLIPFGSVDPWHERRAVHRVHELVRDYGVKGFKFHPSMQAFEPNDRRFYPDLRGDRRGRGARAVPHRARRVSAPGCRAGTASSCATPTRCCSTTWPPTSRS